MRGSLPHKQKRLLWGTRREGEARSGGYFFVQSTLIIGRGKAGTSDESRTESGE